MGSFVCAWGAPAANTPAKAASTASVMSLDVFMKQDPPSKQLRTPRPGRREALVIAERPERSKRLPWRSAQPSIWACRSWPPPLCPTHPSSWCARRRKTATSSCESTRATPRSSAGSARHGPTSSASWRAITSRDSSSPPCPRSPSTSGRRSEEHTSELQSQFHLVCRLLLDQKKKQLQIPCRRKKINDEATR